MQSIACGVLTAAGWGNEPPSGCTIRVHSASGCALKKLSGVRDPKKSLRRRGLLGQPQAPALPAMDSQGILLPLRPG